MHIAQCSANPQWQPPRQFFFSVTLIGNARNSHFIVGVAITYLLISLFIPVHIFFNE